MTALLAQGKAVTLLLMALLSLYLPRLPILMGHVPSLWEVSAPVAEHGSGSTNASRRSDAAIFPKILANSIVGGSGPNHNTEEVGGTPTKGGGLPQMGDGILLTVTALLAQGKASLMRWLQSMGCSGQCSSQSGWSVLAHSVQMP